MRPLDILVVEYNVVDIEFTRVALLKGKLKNTVNVVEDGEAALDYLYQRGAYAQASRPDLILLDLNLPKMSGHDVLTDIKANNSLKSIPVIVLSSSENMDDVRKTYQLNANSFIAKPVTFENFIKVTQAIEEFWIKIVKLPE